MGQQGCGQHLFGGCSGGYKVAAGNAQSHNQGGGERKPCRCRKPGTLLHRRALRRNGLSAGRSAVVGDKWDDVGAGLALGAIAVHLLSGHGREHRARVREKGGGRVILAGGLADGLRRLRAAAEGKTG